MNRPRDVEVELRFLTAEEGGRSTPVWSDYRPQFYYNDRDWDASHEYPDVQEVYPGDSVRAYLAFLSPQEHFGKVYPGMEFECREGHRVVARGRVLRLLDLEESARRAIKQS